MKQLAAVALIFVLALATVATCVPRGPVVVAEQTFSGQTSDLSATTVYTPTADGNFRVSAYIEPSATGRSITTYSYTNWTDDVASGQQCYPAILSAANTFGSGQCYIHALNGDPITIATNSTSVPPGQSYTLMVVVEKI